MGENFECQTPTSVNNFVFLEQDEETNHPPKEPPNMYPKLVHWDFKRHVYYILYNDMRLVKTFRHIFRRDIEDAFISGKFWSSDICQITSNDDNLYFLCRDWTFVELSPKNDVIFDDDTPPSPLPSPSSKSPGGCAKVPKFEVLKVNGRSLVSQGSVQMPHTVQPGSVGNWHIAATGSSLLLYVERTSWVHHFEDNQWKEDLQTEFISSEISDFKVRDDLLYFGEQAFDRISIYRWRGVEKLNLLFTIHAATEGNFALLGRSLVVTKNSNDVKCVKITQNSDSFISDPIWCEQINFGGKRVLFDNNHKMRFTDVGTRDSFTKSVNFDFRIFATASNGKLLLYDETQNRMLYFNL